MAALIAAHGGPSRFVGVAPAAKILPVTVHSSQAAMAPGIRYAVDHGAKVISISQVAAVSCTSDTQRAVAYAIQHDAVVVAGAGNDGNGSNASNSPANCAGVLAVGAVDYKFNPWARTQRQPYVSVAAPGAQVGGLLRDGQFHTSSGGTSPATALTSGAVALVRSKFPNMPAREVVQRIIASARDVGPQGKDDQSGYGLIRPSHALVDKVSKNSPNPVFAAYDKWAAANGEGAAQSRPSGSTAGTGPDWTRVAIFVGGVLVAILLVVFAIVRAGRNRRRRQGYAGPPPQGPGYQQQGYQQGPPPSFGPPQGGPAPPPGRDARRPAPSFEPPDQAPPEGRRRS
jgi:hypothetical protein